MEDSSKLPEASGGGDAKRAFGLLRLFVAGLSGALLALAFPGIGVEVMLWLWLPLLLGVLEIARPPGKRAVWGDFGYAWVAGFVFHFITLRWLSDIWSAGPVLSVLGWVSLSAYLAVYFGVWAVVVRVLARLDGGLLIPSKKRSGVPKREDKIVLDSWRERNAGGMGLPDWLRSSSHVLRNAAISAAAWVALEWVRGWLMGGFGWNGLAVGMHENATLVQIADLVGVSGVSFLPVFCGYVLYATMRRVHAEIRHSRWRPHPDMGFAVALVAACFLYGANRLSQKEEMLLVDVAAVQPFMSQDEKHDYAGAAVQAKKIVEQIDEAFRGREARAESALRSAMAEEKEITLSPLTVDLVLLPESVLPWSLMQRETFDFIEEVRGKVNPGADVVFGTLGAEIDPIAPKSYNTVAVFESGRHYLEENRLIDIPLQFHKVRLVPFGEFLPLRGFPLVETLLGAAVPADFNVGESTAPLDVTARARNYQIAPLLCFEDTIGNHARKFVRKGIPQLLVNVTNDGWFPHRAAALQHTANARFRCIELRRPMVRSANTGVTCVIDSTGSFYDRNTGEFQAILDGSGTSANLSGVLFGTAYLPVNGEITLYAAFGDWFAQGCGLLVLAVLACKVMRSGMRR